jgi:hypothetical protein
MRGRRHLLGAVIVTLMTVIACGVPLSGANALSAPHVAPSPTFTYTVNTTADALPYSSAPAGECEDTGDTSQCSLRAALSAANIDFGTAGEWVKIVLGSGDYELNPTVSTSTPTINHSGSLSLVGAGPSLTEIDGSTLSFNEELLDVDTTNATLSLQGISFTGGKSEDGGAINVDNEDGVTIADCAFTDDTGMSSGGALYLDYNDTLSITGSSFTHDTSENSGGALYDNSYDPITLTGDTLSNDSTGVSGGEGGAIYAQGAVTMSHSTLDSDSSDDGGGGVDAGGDVNLDHDQFASDSSTGSSGGAVNSNEFVTATTSTFATNSSDYDGGAVLAQHGGYFTDDSFDGDSSLYGGDIFGSDNLTINGSTFSHSTAIDNGGAVYAGNALSMDDDTISNASVSGSNDGYGGGALFGNETLGTLDDVTITDASAPNGSAEGGGIDIDNGSIAVSNSSITSSTAAGSGGGIFAEDSHLTLDDSAVTHDVAGQSGGGVEAEGNSDVTITSSTVSSDTSTTDSGGGLAVDENSDLTLENSTLSSDTVTDTGGVGGGIALDSNGTNDESLILNDTLTGNSSSNGGALSIDDSDVVVANSTLDANALISGAPSSGGTGLFNDDGGVVSSDSVWVGSSGYECDSTDLSPAIPIISAGNNLVSDSSCALSGSGDITNASASLSALANNGGATETMAPESGSPVIGAGGTGCQASDQRGEIIPTGAQCDIGSVFLVGSTTTLAIGKPSVIFGKEQLEKFTVTVTPGESAVVPSGSITVEIDHKLGCVLKLTPIKGSAIGASSGSCTLSASELKAGAHSAAAAFATAPELLGSSAKSKTFTVTAVKRT